MQNYPCTERIWYFPNFLKLWKLSDMHGHTYIKYQKVPCWSVHKGQDTVQQWGSTLYINGKAKQDEFGLNWDYLHVDHNTSNYSYTPYQNSTMAWSVLRLCSVSYTFWRNTDLGTSVFVCVEWIIISYLTGSHWPILFRLNLQNNTQAHLRVLWAWMSFASGTESPAQESGCSPNTIFVRVALFQTFTVYYILQPAL